jgi:hypothetical protein
MPIYKHCVLEWAQENFAIGDDGAYTVLAVLVRRLRHSPLTVAYIAH